MPLVTADIPIFLRSRQKGEASESHPGRTAALTGHAGLVGDTVYGLWEECGARVAV